MERLGFHWTDFQEVLTFEYIFQKRKLSQKHQFSLKSEKNIGTLHGDQYTFLITSRPVLLRMKNVSDISRRDNQNTNFVFSNALFFPKIVPFMR